MKAAQYLRLMMVGIGIALITSGSIAAPQPITDAQITRTGFLYNRQTDTFDTTVTVRNGGKLPLAAPLRLVVEGTLPASVSLYNSYGKTEQGKRYVVVPLPNNYQLQPGETAKVPVRFVTLDKNITAVDFSVQAEILDPASTAIINVHAEMDSDSGGGPVGEGFTVTVYGTVRALTDSQGNATFAVPVDATEVWVSYPPGYKGSASIQNLSIGEVRNVSVMVGEGGEFGAESQLRIDRVQHLMLPITVPQVVLRFFQDEKAVVTDFVETVNVENTVNNTLIHIEDLFSIRSDGSFAVDSEAFFNAIGNLGGKKILSVDVLDKQGISHEGIIPFYVSQFTVKARLVAPPSNPTLALGGIPIKVAVMGTDIAFEVESAADGSFPLPLLPAGNLEIKVESIQNKVRYAGWAFRALTSDLRIEVNLLGPTDDDVPSIQVFPL
ncbi:hypothetical protein AGMMS49960_16210 [Betaproteobacteria bacterium]|nr:hypothetical protein AGMMS49543_20330 [Betaproteobacteria bacterium]GHU02882.1 hypothetical protein AGMMS49960_16210 [Betaproteobacteria bacterium]GHU20193.1 hypothetical protein AGMMS50243_14110 [Betaproteobacteria bacterium]